MSNPVDIRGQLPPNYTDDDYNRYGEGMRGNQASLPFAHLTVWAFNGVRNAQPAAAQTPTSYYGGWNMDAEAADEIAGQGGLKVQLDHTGWIKTERNAKGNKTYTVYETRQLHVAPICRRMSWIGQDGRSRTPEYDPQHKKSHLQVLALVGCTMDVAGAKHIQYVAPAVITVKGQGQTEALRDAFLKWSRAIDSLRPQMNAKGIPLFSWWMTIGTRGTAEFKMMGKGKDTFEITPMQALMASDKLTPEQMGARFIGADNFKLAAQLFDDAKPWVEAWKVPSAGLGSRGGQQHGGATHPPGDASEGPEPHETYSGGGYDDGNKDIPF